MSIFKAKLKTFESSITGTKTSYNVNTAFWLYLEEDFGIKQGDLSNLYETENNLTTAKVVVCILKANKFETTLEEVLENTNEIELAQFIIDFQTALYDVEDNQTKDAKNKSEGKSDQ
ncbi:TPA: hypothetical protein PP900_002519 [Staphylococcus aureus]|nr:hypothetical protein [Staphylococcus aureus]HDJ2975023.1 hypothetical protein [Staphylococcus aureus]HDJ3212523.1 hypothetical protein [Staphylococcus aureus]